MQYSTNLNHIFLPRAAEFLIVHDAVQKSVWIIISWTESEKWLRSILICSDEGLWEEERAGRGCVCIGVKKKNPALFFHSRSHCLLFLISVYPVAWQADGSDYTVIINQVRKPWKRWRDDRGGGGRRKGDLWSTHGPAHVSIGPENQRPCSFPSKWRLRPTTKHHERNQEYCLVPKICISFSAAVRAHFDHILIRIDSACKCFALILKDELCSLWSKKFTSLPSNLSFSSTVPVFFLPLYAAIVLWQ